MLIIGKIIFLIFGEEQIFGINKSFGSPEKNVSINFSKGNILKYLSLSLNCNGDNSYSFEMEKSIDLKLGMKILTFQLNFV